jgi:hypothetical protein
VHLGLAAVIVAAIVATRTTVGLLAASMLSCFAIAITLAAALLAVGTPVILAIGLLLARLFGGLVTRYRDGLCSRLGPSFGRRGRCAIG